MKMVSAVARGGTLRWFARPLASRGWRAGPSVFEIAGRDLVKHRRKEEEVVAANEANFDFLSRQHRGQQFLQAQGGINATETAAEDQDAFFSGLRGGLGLR
jgi:hypothetical protein